MQPFLPAWWCFISNFVPWSKVWDRSSGVLSRPCNDTLLWCQGLTRSQQTVSWAKQCLRTTAPSCLWKRASNATTRGHKDKKKTKPPPPSNFYVSIIYDISRKETQTIPLIRQTVSKGWALRCFGVFCFVLFFQPLLQMSLCVSNGFFWFVGWMNGLNNCHGCTWDIMFRLSHLVTRKILTNWREYRKEHHSGLACRGTKSQGKLLRTKHSFSKRQLLQW